MVGGSRRRSASPCRGFASSVAARGSRLTSVCAKAHTYPSRGKGWTWVVGTSHSAISRLESGQHRASIATLERVGEALGLRLVVSLEPVTA